MKQEVFLTQDFSHFSIVAFALFAAVFLGVLIRLFVQRKKCLKRVQELPLHD